MCCRFVPVWEYAAKHSRALRNWREREMELSKLRPVFFRTGECDETTYSGWINVQTLDIWAHEDDARAFSNESGNEHGMLLVRGARLALTVGERITFVRGVDVHPATNIEAGERGVVGRRDKSTGTTEIFLEQYHVGLDYASNCLAVRPHCDFDGVLQAIRPYAKHALIDLNDYRG
jgi:hypothetical protein